MKDKVANLAFVAMLVVAFSLFVAGLNQSTDSDPQEVTAAATPTPTRTPTPISIGNFVWDDLDNDGFQDVGEPGLGCVTVQLWNSTATVLIDSTTTDANGQYRVISPTPGTVRVRVIKFGSGSSFSPVDQGADDQKDSDIIGGGAWAGFTNPIVLGSSLISTTKEDAGIHGSPSSNCATTVGDRVFNDRDFDGIQDAGEPGLGGVTVRLTSGNKATVHDETVSASDGSYVLDVPSGGQYRIAAVLPTQARFSPPNVGADDLIDSDINDSGPDVGYSNTFLVTEGVLNDKHDIGIQPPPPPVYVPLNPARLLDSRSTGETIDDKFAGIGLRQGGSSLALDVAGRGGVPSNAKAVVLNVTATESPSAGYITAYPCGEEPPLASNVNFVAGQVVPNAVTVKLGDGGKVCLFTSVPTHIVVDVAGYFPTTTKYVPLVPARLADSRGDGETVDDLYRATGQIGAGKVMTIAVRGRGGVANSAGAAVVNVTATNPGAAGYLTVYACNATRPNASNLNYVAGQTTPNMVITSLGTGSICIYAFAPTDVVVDVAGYFPSNVGYVPLVPARVLDTRATGETVDDKHVAVGAVKGATSYTLPVRGRGGVANNATAVVANVTVTEPIAGGFAAVYPCGQPVPTASNLNFVAGQTTPNAVIAKIGAGGAICLYTNVTTHMIVDVNGVVLPFGQG